MKPEIAIDDKDYLPRDVTLRISPEGSSHYFVSAMGENYFHSLENWQGNINLTRVRLFELINQCRKQWENALRSVQTTVSMPQGGSRVQYVLQECVDLTRWRNEVESIGTDLAEAGKQLVYHVFQEAADNDARELFSKLFALMRERSLVLTVVSNDFFVPWSLLYLDENDGMKFDWMNFSGARHVIEHNPAQRCTITSAKLQASSRFSGSFSHDDRIDRLLRINALDKQKQFFESHVGITAQKFTKRQDFEKYFSNHQLQDQLIYFFCHGKVSHNGDGTLNLDSAELSLTDDRGINANDLSYWRKREPLKSNPFVFLNACQSAQPETVFHQALAPKFLELGANCLIGPQTNIPAVFADEYARRLLGKMLVCNPGDESPRLGIVMRDLVQHFINDYHNPLALVYSSHRGTDVRFSRRKEEQ